MQPDTLKILKRNLFEEDLISLFCPENIVELNKEELNPFSDYYGVLIQVEKFFGNQNQYKETFPEEFEQNQSQVISQLLINMFVPNYKTLRGKLNDRVRLILNKNKVLPSSNTLDEVINDLIVSKHKLDKLHDLGFPSTERDKLKSEFEDYQNRVSDYSDLVQESLFALRPQVITSEVDVSALVAKHGNLLQSLKEGSEVYQNVRSAVLEELSSLNLEGDPIEEAQFYYKGNDFKSTHSFVKEWKKAIKQIKRLRNITDASSDTSLKFRMPNLRIPKKTLITALGIGALFSTAFFFPPEWKYKLSLPLTSNERIELLYGRGEFTDLSLTLAELRKEKEISEGLASYWKGNMFLEQFRKNLDSENSLEKKYNIVRQHVESNVPLMVEAGREELGDEKILTSFFDAGYVKRGDYFSDMNNFTTPKMAAHSYLSKLLDQPPEDLEEVELKLVETIRDTDVIYVGEGPGVYFLTKEWDDIRIFVEKKGKKYEINNIEIIE